MIEVEVKARINDINKIKENLTNINAKFLKSENQIDKIFGHPNFLDSENMIIEGGILPRIRVVDDKKILEFKEISRQGGGIEIKSELSDIDIGLKLLQKLGFKEAFTVSKSRETYSYNGFSICLDKVEQLGDFIEIEKMINSTDKKEEIRNECLNLLNKLSPNSEIENKKYGDLIQEKINKVK